MDDALIPRQAGRPARLFARRTGLVVPSATLSTMDRANDLRRSGVDIFSFSNRPSPPQAAVAGAKAALDAKWSSFYTDTAGIPELRGQIAERASVSLKRSIDPDSEVLVTVGGKEAIFAFLMATVQEGDEVIIPDPAWVTYEPCIRLAGGRPVRVPLTYTGNGFEFDTDGLRRSVTPNTRALILNTPHNPTGLVLSAEVLHEIATIAIENDLFVLADECYEHYVYEGEHRSIAALPRMFERTLTVSTSSKIFTMFGWRLGWAIGPSEMMHHLLNIHQNIVACATSFAQAGMAKLLASDPEELLRLIARTVSIYRAARDALVQGLNRIDGVRCHSPQGGYLAFVNIRGLNMRSNDVSELLLDRAGVQTVPGSAFGPAGEGFVRINFSCTAEDVADGLRRINEALSAGAHAC
jgi:aspartate/methionine/tyrosine aminotransferase